MNDVMVKIHDDPWVADEKVLSFDAMHWVMCPLLRAGGEAVGARPPLTGHLGQPLWSLLAAREPPRIPSFHNRTHKV